MTNDGDGDDREEATADEPEPGTPAWRVLRAAERLAADDENAAAGGLRLYPEHV